MKLIMETENISRISQDLELLKKAITEIKVAINLEPELKEEIKQRVKEARCRISDGEIISNEDILKEFDLK